MYFHSCPKSSPVSSSLLEARARGFRNTPNFAELALWSQLRGRRLGVLFRRQVPVGGRYIADLLAPELKLIVEVDGECHARRRDADARRDRVLERLGYHILRIDAVLIIRDLPRALNRIRAELQALRSG